MGREDEGGRYKDRIRREVGLLIYPQPGTKKHHRRNETPVLLPHVGSFLAVVEGHVEERMH